MLPEVAAYVDELGELHAQAKKLIQLDASALDYVPGKGLNSMCAIVTHMAGSQKWWIGENLDRRDMHRDREAEFHAAGVAPAELAKRLDESLAFVIESVGKLTPEMLAETRIARGQPVSVRYILCHVLAHTSIHVGHLEITRQLWDASRS